MGMQKRQQIQYEHDLKNHFDILSLSRVDRIKHYGLHFAKYAGRLARGAAEKKTRQETIVDAFLVSLSAANALNQLLPEVSISSAMGSDDLGFIDCSGKFADACEKVDHLEEFREIALGANAGIAQWLMRNALESGMDLDVLVAERRKQLASRVVYSAG